MKVLIIDDNSEVREMIGRFISEFADEIIELDRGELALETYRKQQPDWVLMDLQMEGMDGIKATGQIISEYPDAKIAIVTSIDQPIFRKKAGDAGALLFILKENLSELRQIFG